MNRCGFCLFCGNQCMADFMISYNKFFLIGKNPVLLLISGDNYFNTLLKISLCSKFSTVTDCTERSLIYNIGKLCTGSSCCSLGNLIKTDGVCNFNLLGMNFKDILSSLQIRKLYRNTSVKTTRSEKSRIKRIRSVSSSKDNNTLRAIKTVHLCQQLI